MGGNLFKLGRLPKTEYLEIEAGLRQYLDQKLGDLYHIPRCFRDKPDFGDVDIIVSDAAIHTTWQDLRTELIKDLGIQEHKSLGSVFSTVYQNFQVDFFYREHRYFDSTYNYLSFNDVGNILGKIFKRFNLKYGEQGLQYVFRRADGHFQKDLEVSQDFQRIFAFLQLDYAHWVRGFDTLDELFRWVTASPYFSIQPYQEQDATTSQRIKERTTMRRFVQWLEEKGVLQKFEFEADRDVYLPMIAAFFPEGHLLEKIELERQREAYVLRLREKYSGQVIMRLFPDLQGKALGDFMRSFEAQWADHEAVLAAMEPSEIVEQLSRFKANY
ncbi:hypothetical protein [Haliscomenobacter sp.]|uniref:hypothetical protein n=1 Tax=Haliscomenobacter sp. TaxID=2717303 RepID=UPI0035935B40